MRKYVPEIESSGLSVVGPVREDNQDSFRLSDNESPIEHGLLFAIADGMGGYAHGGMASRMALESFYSVLAGQNGNAIPRVLQRGIEAANLRVYQTAQQLGVGKMGTTLTAAYLYGDMLHMAHVGDSRAYLIRDRQAICLTEDHTMVGDMVRSKIISADKIRTHTQRSILTRSIGLDLFIQPDITQHKLKEGDRLILCSDGVWSVVEDDEFAEIACQANSAEEGSHELIDLALQRDTDDNASVVMFHLQRLIPVSEEQGANTQKHQGWFQNLWKFAS